jgi:hypothetical protein
MSILKDIFTGVDGETHDVGRYLWVLSVLAGLGYAGYDLIFLKTPFDIVKYGIGVGSLLAAGGGALMLKRDTEPK